MEWTENQGIVFQLLQAYRVGNFGFVEENCLAILRQLGEKDFALGSFQRFFFSFLSFLFFFFLFYSKSKISSFYKF